MAERYNANFFEVLIGQVAEDGEIDIVLSKVVSVLGHADLLKRIPTRRIAAAPPELLSAPRLDAVSLSNKGLQCDAFGRPVSQFGRQRRFDHVLALLLCPNSRPINVSQQITFRAISRHLHV